MKRNYSKKSSENNTVLPSERKTSRQVEREGEPGKLWRELKEIQQYLMILAQRNFHPTYLEPLS